MNSVLSKAPAVARIFFGLIFFVFGLNGFLNFLPQPPLPESAMGFMGGMMAAPYFFPVLKATEVIAGAALLSGFFVPLALILLAPIVVQIALFHIVLAPGLPMVILLVGLESYLAYAYRDSFRGVLNAKAKPVAAKASA